VLWAPATTSWDAAARTCTIHGVDTDRLDAHFLREGDDALASGNGFGGKVPCDYRGLRMLRDAANNTSAQDARFVAPLGIKNGATNTASLRRTKFERGTNVLAAMREIPGCHWRLIALDVDDPASYPNYMELKVTNDLGVDRSTGSDAVVYHYGYGLNNLENFTAEPAGFITHAHVLSGAELALTERVTRYNADSSRYRGIYVHWAATQHKLPFDGFQTTTTEALDASETGVDVAIPGAPKDYQSEDFVIQIDSERMLVTGGRTTATWTVTRGYDGTTAATHSNGATVRHVGVLELTAEEIIEDYGLPQQAYTLTLHPDSAQQQPFFEWADPGDTILAGCKTGYLYIEEAMQVLRMSVRSTGRLHDTTPELTVAKQLVPLSDVDAGEA
jgi:hypothetical protein